MYKYVTSSSTALSDTTKKLLDTLTLPETTKRIVSAGGYAVGGPGNTTLENCTGMLEIESDDINIAPCQLPLDCYTITGTGVSAFKPTMYPIDYQGGAKSRIKGSMTLDLAQTLANTGRFTICVEV